jgi:hypothetical protein
MLLTPPITGLVQKSSAEHQSAYLSAGFTGEKRLGDMTYDQLIAQHEEFHTHCDLSRFGKRTSMGYPAPADANGARPYLCEQDTEELIHRIKPEMQNLIPLSVPDVIDHALQLRCERFHAGIAFLRNAKCYQGINSLTSKDTAESCRWWLNWFAGQHRLKIKSARLIAGNRLTAGTKLKIEPFSKTFDDLIQSFLLELIFSADETIVNMNKACKSLFVRDMQR